jgi:hypothetical protein
MGPGQIRLLLGHCSLGWWCTPPLTRVTDTSTPGHKVGHNKGQATRDNDGREPRRIEHLRHEGSSQSYESATVPIDGLAPISSRRSVNRTLVYCSGSRSCRNTAVSGRE